MDTFAHRYLHWIFSLGFELPLPGGVYVLNPYSERHVQHVVTHFAHKFYGDSSPRIGVFGINPGRFGAGTTGVIFTDPVALRTLCGIDNALGTRRELSSQFVYTTIEAFGGVDVFYRHFYLSALVPLGFIKEGRNLNFYDHPELLEITLPFAANTLRQQLEFPLFRRVAILLGSGKLAHIAQRLNEKYCFFEQLLVLDHPRFIMQYRRRQFEAYIEQYVRTYHDALALCKQAVKR